MTRNEEHDAAPELARRKPSPHRVDDPRDNPDNPGQPKPIPGKKPGVGYIPRGMSYAGDSHGFGPFVFDLRVDLEGAPPNSDEYLDRLAKMVAGGGIDAAQAGAPGFEWPQIEQILRRAWECREAPLLTDPDDFNGIPTETEIRRAYYAQYGDKLLQEFYGNLARRDADAKPPVGGITAPEPSVEAIRFRQAMVLFGELQPRVLRLEQMLGIGVPRDESFQLDRIQEREKREEIRRPELATVEVAAQGRDEHLEKGGPGHATRSGFQDKREGGDS